MYGSGVRIGIVRLTILSVTQPILRDRPQALSACFAAAVGTSTRDTAALLVAATTRPPTATTASGSASSSPSNNRLLHVKEIHWLLKDILSKEKMGRLGKFQK